MLLNNVNSFFVITQIRYMKSAQPCSGFANQQMFFRAAKSARPWSSPEPFEKKAYFVCRCLTSFAKPAGRPAARPAQCGPAGRPARAPPRGVQRNFDSQKLVLSDPDLIISLQQMRGQIQCLLAGPLELGGGNPKRSYKEQKQKNLLHQSLDYYNYNPPLPRIFRPSYGPTGPGYYNKQLCRHYYAVGTGMGQGVPQIFCQ